MNRQDSQRVWVEVPAERVEQFRMAVMKLRQQAPGKTTSQVIEDAVMAQASALVLVDQAPGMPATTVPRASDDARILRVIARREAPTARDIRVFTRTLPLGYINEALGRLVRQGLVEPTATSHSIRYRLTKEGRDREP